ncbi:hypothetical protein CEXT_613391 [Caerostris extrusa]|uniref:Uncharacterized protein n=1 Tax=Caerostris extrusa TaxID=172846 RepID=A0AAV4RD18_CAEEX|nr:hypothetical protein CEXT_613391 [Caerostris extrusa]
MEKSDLFGGEVLSLPTSVSLRKIRPSRVAMHVRAHRCAICAARNPPHRRRCRWARFMRVFFSICFHIPFFLFFFDLPIIFLPSVTLLSAHAVVRAHSFLGEVFVSTPVSDVLNPSLPLRLMDELPLVRDLSHNQLRSMNSTIFHKLGSLQKLIINHNHLVELPEFGRNLSIEVLSVAHNEIHSLNSSILEDLPKLHTLDLSFNNLVDLPANTFGNSSSLLYLSLSHNRIVSLEKELFRQLSSLQHLEINSNGLTQIEGLSFQGLASLVVLKIRHSGIQYLQDGSFYGLNSIKKLQLDSNDIKKVTKGWLYGLNSLQRLYINNNNISEIEDGAWDSGKRLLEL